MKSIEKTLLSSLTYDEKKTFAPFSKPSISSPKEYLSYSCEYGCSIWACAVIASMIDVDPCFSITVP